MPRDSSGNMTLPAGNPNVPDTVISSSGWSNPTMTDLANEITNSLDRNGRGGMLAPFRFVDGDVTGPGMSWTNEPGTGFYRAGSGDQRVSVQGADSFRWAPVAAMWNITDSVWYTVANAKYFSNDTTHAQLLDDAVVRLATTAVGFDATGTVFDFNQQTDNSILLRMLNSIGGLRIIVPSTTADPGINQVDNAGVFEHTWVNFIRDAGMSFNFAGSQKMEVVTEGVEITGQISASASVPVNNNELTRKDYVDDGLAAAVAPLASTAYVDAADGALQSDIDDNTGDIATNTAELAGISSATAQQTMRIDNMMHITARSAAASASNISVTFAVPFTSAPHVVVSAWNPTNANNAFGWVKTVTTTGFTATFPTGIACEWSAMGSKTN